VLETGYDILFFWVARMIMFGLEFTGQAPFHTVYLHGIIRDGEGRKMSKTLGNVIDPREVMDEFGTDALRFTLLTAGTPGQDLNLSLQRVESNRNFANKIWNMARFVTGNLAGDITPPSASKDSQTLADQWILARLNETIAAATQLFERYEFGQAGTVISEFLWSAYADWYIEIAKKVGLVGDNETSKATTRGILLHVLDQGLRLLHPFVPFVTEEVWQRVVRPSSEFPALIVAAWPEAGPIDYDALTRFSYFQDITQAIRNARAEQNIPPHISIPGVLIVAGEKRSWLDQQPTTNSLSALGRIEPTAITITGSTPPEIPFDATPIFTSGSAIYIDQPSLPAAIGTHQLNLDTQLKQLDDQISKSLRLLNSEFGARAPAAVVERERAKLAELRQSRERIVERLRSSKR